MPQDPPHKVGIPTLKIDLKPTLEVAIFRVGIPTFGLLENTMETDSWVSPFCHE